MFEGVIYGRKFVVFLWEVLNEILRYFFMRDKWGWKGLGIELKDWLVWILCNGTDSCNNADVRVPVTDNWTDHPEIVR